MALPNPESFVFKKREGALPTSVHGVRHAEDFKADSGLGEPGSKSVGRVSLKQRGLDSSRGFSSKVGSIGFDARKFRMTRLHWFNLGS